jgi:predicted ATPase/DNA-binding SARP family transcriptional activator/DNA-binding CsgD family transcriptional regulator
MPSSYAPLEWRNASINAPGGPKGRTRFGPPDNERPEAVRIWLLGDFRVSIGSELIKKSTWRLRKASALVKLLALAPGRLLHREQVMDLLWPDSGRRAASNNLRQTLYAARRALAPDPSMGAGYLASKDESLVLCPEGWLWVDVDAFEEAAASARRTRSPAAHRVAIELYAGELLPDDRYEEWSYDRREFLRRLYLELLAEFAGQCEDRGEYGAAADARRRIVVEEPTNELAQAELMRVYVLSDRPEDALAQYKRFGKTLSPQSGTEPGATTRLLHAEIAAGRFPPAQRASPQPEQPPDAGTHNLPSAITNFVGREREMVEVKKALAMTGLLTLTGTGGCGKTRLALEVARDLVGIYADGVWLAELAPLSEGVLVPQELAAKLGVREQPGRPLTDTLLDALRDKEMLLILDNCEHLIDAAARFAEALLGSCPRLRVLATSRKTLGARGELGWLVPSLSVPDTRQPPDVDELGGYESARLFADRASRRQPGFALTPENATAVARVCAGLDGIPLAIELAAARVGTLSAEQISGRLEHSLKLLTISERTADHRHRTLRAALDWSHELLDMPERVLFRRLSAFSGGFTLEAAEGVGVGGGIEEEDVLDLLSRLVDESLVVAEESWESGARYRLLEPVRQYARENLGEGVEAGTVARRHAEWYLALAEEADRESGGPGHAGWLRRLETEHDNLRAALRWSLEGGDVELGLRLAGALWLFWFTRGYASEGREWLERGVSLGHSPAARARALNGAGWIVMFQGDFAAARTLLEKSLALYRELKDEEGIASSLNFLGYVGVLGQWEDLPVEDLLQEALALKPRLKNRRTIAGTLIFAGIDALLLRGDWNDAVALHEEALALYREMDDKWGINLCLVNLGLMAAAAGNRLRATAMLQELMHVSLELDDRLTNMYSFFGLACVADSEGQTARAVRLWAISERILDAAGLQLPPSTHAVMKYESRLARARSALDESAFEAAWTEGKAMTPEEAVEYALSEVELAAPTASEEELTSSEPLSNLTHREQEVADLVTQGLTNRQISTELGISERTAGNHVTKILRKLELQSRAQIATWTTEHRLITPDPN